MPDRIHPDRQTSDVTNWHSASQLSGFGTPGYINSQFSQNDGSNHQFWISPKVFTPGSDGLHDNATIHYGFDHPGYLANIVILNAEGRLVRRLVNNELLGTTGSYSWDGITDSNQKASTGIYIILAELMNLKGKVERYKETVVVAP